MVIKGIRFSEEFGFCCCGPVGGPTRVEVMFYDEGDHSFFINASRYDVGLQVSKSKVPLFDILSHSFEGAMEEFEKAQKYSDFFDEYCLDDEYSGFGKHHRSISSAIEFTLFILQQIEEGKFSERDCEKYVDKDISEVDFKKASWSYDDDDEE